MPPPGEHDEYAGAEHRAQADDDRTTKAELRRSRVAAPRLAEWDRTYLPTGWPPPRTGDTRNSPSPASPRPAAQRGPGDRRPGAVRAIVDLHRQRGAVRQASPTPLGALFAISPSTARISL
jgi:hypothetical protein